MEITWAEVHATVAVYNKRVNTVYSENMRDIRLRGKQFYFIKYVLCNCRHVSVMCRTVLSLITCCKDALLPLFINRK